ncbi:AraC family transcriptional regulator [Polaribacter sp. Hel_I_88]|uniref:helix-turn-helix domain-containing protein n=1 Tax=Polaribacter sp. Hel_I_88 TaxID=1250006 RepID=UPI000478E8B3|nr:helix-turn-helix domain-containing protein [Polaribacter sp. Hel_I_88]
MSQKFAIEDHFVEDIVKEMAINLSADFKEEDNITSFKIPEINGVGEVLAVQFASGLGIMNSAYKLNEDLVLKMNKNRINPLKFVFNLGDTFYHNFGKEGDFESIPKYSGAIIGSSIDKTHSFKIPKDKNIHIFSLELNRNLFEHKLASFKFNLGDELSKLLRDVKAENPFFYTYPFGSEEFEMIHKILHNTKKGFIGSLYKEGVTYTILSNTLETYLGNTLDNDIDTLSEKDTDQVVIISKFIEDNLSDLPTIEEIANKNFLSESKLQKLFNIYYSCSVHDFTRNKRLDRARILLEDANYTIAEIADELGIRSNSYFSKIFKERYGVTPSKYKNSRLSEIRIY